MTTTWMWGSYMWKTILSNLRERTDHQIKVMGESVCHQVFSISKSEAECDPQGSVEISWYLRAGCISSKTKAIHCTPPPQSLPLWLACLKAKLWPGRLMEMRHVGKSVIKKNWHDLFKHWVYGVEQICWSTSMPKRRSIDCTRWDCPEGETRRTLGSNISIWLSILSSWGKENECLTWKRVGSFILKTSDWMKGFSKNR